LHLVLVGLGGAAGAAARYKLGKIISQKAKMTFPIGTFLINISGALLLGLLTGAGCSDNAYLVLGDGFLGAFTTFSTFMYEGIVLVNGKERLSAAFYVILTLFLGVGGYFIGYVSSKLFV
jgi:CrcB protein